jgi:hypothetical protein
MSARILKIVGPAHIVGGLLLFLTAFSPAAQAILEDLLSTSANLEWSPFFIAVLGPTIASWGVLFTVVVTQFLAAPSPGLWKAMVISVAIWAPLDTALCLYFSVYGGAVVNAVIVAVLTVLLLGVRAMAYSRPLDQARHE